VIAETKDMAQTTSVVIPTPYNIESTFNALVSPREGTTIFCGWKRYSS